MLCSNCKKNTAVVFINKKNNEGKQELDGLCYECAKKMGINPFDTLMKQANLSEKDLNDMTNQFEEMFKDMTANMNLAEINPDTLSKIAEESNDDDNLDNQASSFGAIPLGSIFSNMFGSSDANNNEQQEEVSSNSNERKKVKVDKKNKKRKALDTFGTNLTNKAKNGQLDAVIGRNKEIQRIIQMLNW